jgi:hypothetical protein
MVPKDVLANVTTLVPLSSRVPDNRLTRPDDPGASTASGLARDRILSIAIRLEGAQRIAVCSMTSLVGPPAGTWYNQRRPI